MRIHEYRWLAGLICGLTLPLASAHAQQPADQGSEPSYVVIQPPGTGADAADLVKQKLARLQGLSDTENLLQKFLADPRAADILKHARELGITPQTIEKYAHGGLENAPIDKDLKEQLRNLIREHKQQLQERFHLKPEQQTQMDKALQSLPETQPKTDSGTTSPARGQVGKQPTIMSGPQRELPNSGPEKSSSVPPETQTPPATNTTPVPEEGGISTNLANWLLEQSRHMKNMGGVLRNSQALQHAIDHLDKYLSGQRTWQPGSGSSAFTERLGKLIADARSKPMWSVGSLPHLPSLSVPSLPRPPLPHVRLPRVHLPGVRPPHLGIGTPGPGSGKAVLWLLVIVVALVLLWRLSRATRSAEWLGIRRGAGLGPWPIDPAAVRTREQLVQAFEYLSLLRLGPASRSWNHLQIAAGLGGNASPSREAAEQLAALYEQARYMPEREPLSADAVWTARHTLTLLAGVAQA